MDRVRQPARSQAELLRPVLCLTTCSQVGTIGKRDFGSAWECRRAEPCAHFGRPAGSCFLPLLFPFNHFTLQSSPATKDRPVFQHLYTPFDHTTVWAAVGATAWGVRLIASSFGTERGCKAAWLTPHHTVRLVRFKINLFEFNTLIASKGRYWRQVLNRLCTHSYPAYPLPLSVTIFSTACADWHDQQQNMSPPPPPAIQTNSAGRRQKKVSSEPLSQKRVPSILNNLSQNTK